jgi:DNA-directed RNA polymerase beta subunit
VSPINPSPELQLPEPTADKSDQAPASLPTAAIPVSQPSEPLTAAVSLAPPVPIRPPVAPVAAAPLQMRSFTDARAIRANIYDRVLQATREMQPLSNTVHTLRLRDVDYMDPDTVSKRDQKLAILNNLTPSRRLRGTWELVDNATGAVVDTRKSVVMRVPHFTDRGTFINKGVEYALKNQQRLLPGVYTRIQANGDVESHANIMPGKGPAHRYYLDPEKNTLKIKIGQGTVGLLPLLKIMGVSDRELQEAWGGHVYAANLRSNNAAEYAKLRSKFLSSSDLKKPLHEQDELLRAKFEGMELDPKVTASTLGKGYDRMSPDAVMAISKKLIAVAKGESDVDDRDSLAYQRFYGPEDLLEERIRRDKDGIRRNLLWKLSGKGNLKSMPPSVLTSQLQSALISSGLGLALEEINPTEILDKMTSTTRMGEGGIGSTDAIPVEARSVQPSMLNFIDPLRTPESSKVGIDVYMARGTMKGSDGKLYSQFTDAKTGQTTYKNPQEVAELTVGFPDALRSGEEYVPAMKQGRMEWVKPD